MNLSFMITYKIQYSRSDRFSFGLCSKFIGTSVHARLQIFTYSVMICALPLINTQTHMQIAFDQLYY